MLKKMMLSKYPNGKVDSGEVGLEISNGMILPCGIYGMWESND